MERWSIELAKEYFKFSAAHFLIFPDGSSERLHGHNYRVRVEIEARLTRHGLVLDFKMVKPVIRELLDSLDEHWLVPGEHPTLTYTHRADLVSEGHVTIADVQKMVAPTAKTLDEARGLITAAYQDTLEKEWIQELRNKYKVSVNKEVLYSIQ